MITVYRIAALAFIIGIIIVPLSIRIWERVGPKEKNFLGKRIPVGVGIILTLPVIITGYIQNLSLHQTYLIFIVGLILVGIAGLIDDIIGNPNIKGIKGHFNALFKGEITTGLLKVIMGSLISIISAIIISGSMYSIIINFLLLLLFINALNLFDLRPGRSFKVFFILIFLAWYGATYNRNLEGLFYLFPLASTGIILFIFDLRGKVMLGDAGSNILGFSIGFGYAIIFSLYTKILFVSILILMHLITERVSLSEIIKNNFLLRYLDNLGRIK